MPPSRRIASILIALVFTCCLSLVPARSQTEERPLPISSHLFWGGYISGKLFGYYNRSLANFATLTNAQKNYDTGIMIALSANLERAARALGCSPDMADAIEHLESELNTREAPKDFRLSLPNSLSDCIAKYSSDLRCYWWTGRSVGRIEFLFENLERPEGELQPNSLDRRLLEELKTLDDNSIVLYGTKDFSPRVEDLLKALSKIRSENSEKGELDAKTRNFVKQYVKEIPQSFVPH